MNTGQRQYSAVAVLLQFTSRASAGLPKTEKDLFAEKPLIQPRLQRKQYIPDEPLWAVHQSAFLHEGSMIVESLIFDAGTRGSICTIENLAQGVNVIRGAQASGKSTAHALATLTLFGEDFRDRRRNSALREQAHYLLTDRDRQPDIKSGQPVALHASAFDRHELAALRRCYALDFTCENPRQALREHLGLVTSLGLGNRHQTQPQSTQHDHETEAVEAEIVRLDDSIAGLTSQISRLQQQRQCAQQASQRTARAAADQVFAEIEYEIRRLDDPTSCDLCTCRQFPARLRPLLHSLHECLNESAGGVGAIVDDQYDSLVCQLSEAAQRLMALRQNRDQLADQRANLVETESAYTDIWRQASDYLARMSAGDLTQIAPAGGVDCVQLCDESGQWISPGALTVGACDLARMSLSLALADRHHRLGVQLPMLLDEPSRNLDKRHWIGLLSLLEQCAHDGRQLVMFVSDDVPTNELLERGFAVHQIGNQDHQYCSHCGTLHKENVTLTSERWWNSQSNEIDLEGESSIGVAQHSAALVEAGEPQGKSRSHEVEWSDEHSGHSTTADEESSDFNLVARINAVKQRDEYSEDILEIDSHRETMRQTKLQESNEQQVDFDQFHSNRRTTGSSNRIGGSNSSSNRESRKLRQRKKRIRQRKTSRNSQRRTERGSNSALSRRITTSRSRDGQDNRTVRSATTGSQRISKGQSTSQHRRISQRRDTTDVQGERASESHSSQTRAERSGAKQRSETTRSLRYYLNTTDPVVDAPEIGPKMAERLAKIDIHTVQDLLQADPESTAERLKHRRTNAEVVRRWQNQSRLMCQVPQIRGHDAQILVACEITQRQQLAASDAETLYAAVEPFSKTKAGARIIRGGQQPDLQEVRDWISWAQSAAKASAA